MKISGQRRAIGIVRVSQTSGREGERFASPPEQRERIRAVCERDSIDLIAIQELDVSGGKPLDERPGLGPAVQAIENGEADVIAAAYFDRLFRSLTTQAEAVERVERAGGQVLAVDVGAVSHATAGQWLSGTMMGAVSEYYRRSAGERTRAAQVRAVARGALPWSHTQLGYRRRRDGTLEVDPDAAPLVREAFELRDHGDSVMAVRAFLVSRGVQRSYRGVQVMLADRIYLGEIHFGTLVNLHAHEAIIDRELWHRVQAKRATRGRKPTGEPRLLSRLGILRCGSCGARLSTMRLPRQNDYPIYRCPSTNDCPSHVTISAELAERAVWEQVKALISDAKGTANSSHDSAQLADELAQAQKALDRAVRAFSGAGLMDEPSAADTLAELRAARDTAQANLYRQPPDLTEYVTVDDDMPLSAKRALITAVIDRVDVAPARGKLPKGAGRLTIKPLA